MKAVVIHAAKDLRIEEREPEAPGPGQVEVAIGAGGICGSDLHYYNHGGFGTVRIREPMILGHEVAGTIRSLGEGVSGLAIGDRVAVSPSRPCQHCEYCLKGLQNQCLNMRFYGSAMPMPHIQGAFRQSLVAEHWQCHKVAEGVSINEAAFAEPLAVTLHAVNRAGSLLGKRVLVTGCGPIGIFAVGICKAAGASRIIATDVNDTRLALAREMGAHDAVHPGEAEQAVQRATDGLGVDVVLEMSGVPAAIHQAFALVRVGGKVQMLGIPAKPMEVNFATEVIFKGITVYGVVGRRMYDTWIQMRQFLRSGQFDPTPAITHRFPLEAYDEAIGVIKSGEAGKVVFEIA